MTLKIPSSRPVELFDDFEFQLKRHTYEYAIVLQRGGRTFALVVDSLVVFDTFAGTISELPLTARNTRANFVTRIGKAGQRQHVARRLILDPDLLHDAAFS